MSLLTVYWNLYNKGHDFFGPTGLLVNGTVAFVALVWVVFSSFAPIRNWSVPLSIDVTGPAEGR